ncbi:MAG: site-2 protease family protein [Pseudomonadota bacterium]|nr:site-2 protease family protein [Pseudomonadota bacterium]
MNRAVRLGRVAGIDVFMDWSLLIIFFLIAFSLAVGLFPAWHPDWSPGLSWLTALAAAVLFLASVFVHELSHALVGRAKGIEIRRITLFIFGGMAHLEREPHAWRAELWMAIVGPITSLLLGVFFIVLGNLLAGPMAVDPTDPQRTMASFGPLTTLLFWLGPINIILGIFNLVPGFPLDGGRVLRAILWGATGDLRRATRWASQLGQLFAWVLIGTGIAMMLGIRMPIFGVGFINGLWLAFIGWFLNNAALMSYRQLLVRETLEDVPVRRMMQTRFATVAPDLSVGELVDRYLMPTDQRAYPVLDDGRLVGLVCLHDIRKVSRESWPLTPVREVMTPAADVAHIGPADDTADALFLITRRGVNQLPVVESGQVRGLIRREDIMKWLTLHENTSASP